MLSLLIGSSAELKSVKTAFDSMGFQLIALLGLIFVLEFLKLLGSLWDAMVPYCVPPTFCIGFQ
jgi:hypothetical protein